MHYSMAYKSNLCTVRHLKYLSVYLFLLLLFPSASIPTIIYLIHSKFTIITSTCFIIHQKQNSTLLAHIPPSTIKSIAVDTLRSPEKPLNAMTIEKYHNDRRISACENNWYLCSLHLCGAACGSAVCLPALRTIVGYVAFNFSFSIWHATCFANAGERTTQHKQSTVVIHEKCRSQFQSYLLINISLRMYLHAYGICVEVIAQSSFRCSVRRDEWKKTKKS